MRGRETVAPAGAGGDVAAARLSWAIRLRYWGVVTAWMIVISWLSSDAFSASNTHRYLDPLLRALFPDLTAAQLFAAHAVIRKAAHFGEFLVLSVLAFWAFRGGRQPGWSAAWMAKALLFSVAYAAADELHQSFVSSRTGSAWDSVIDTLGAAAGQVVVYLRHRVQRYRLVAPALAFKPFEG